MKSLNSRTTTKKVWDKFRKVNGNNKPRIIPPPDKIVDTFADHYANILRDRNRKSKPEKNRKKETYHTINH